MRAKKAVGETKWKRTKAKGEKQIEEKNSILGQIKMIELDTTRIKKKAALLNGNLSYQTSK